MNDVSEEGIDQNKETCIFKEAMSNTHKKKFVEEMIYEIENHSSRKHWTHCLKKNVLVGQALRSTWKFRLKRNRSTGDIIKFKARFCADGMPQQLGVNRHESCSPAAKWNAITTCLTMVTMCSW